uniref:Uncharacterized protein n=1 Tax=Aplanochytrium stocchinoi TaxID=215587 RepID=A0A7S3PMM8_9STRA
MSKALPTLRRGSSGEPIHDFGTVVQACGYFDHRHKDRGFLLKAEGRSPPRHRDHEHPESPKGNLGKEALEKICKELGCIAFTTNTGRLFVRLPEEIEWIHTPDEDLYELSDSQPPWHHVDINYTLPNENIVFESFSYDVEFSNDVSNDVNLYLCLFGGNMNTGHFYVPGFTRFWIDIQQMGTL